MAFISATSSAIFFTKPLRTISIATSMAVANPIHRCHRGFDHNAIKAGKYPAVVLPGIHAVTECSEGASRQRAPSFDIHVRLTQA
jgi:hypothetical protein